MAVRMHSEKSLSAIVFCIIFLVGVVPSADAGESLWTYSSPDDEIEDLTISSDGSVIAVAAGKIWLFSKNGVLLGKEPYGDQVILTPDGSYLISSYSDSLYKFKRNALSKGSESPLQKVWEASLPGPIREIDVSDDGNTVVASLNRAGIFIYDVNGKMTGGDITRKTIARISSQGERIIGVSNGVLCRYNRDAVCIKSEEGQVGQESPVGAMPDFLEISGTGNIAVFNQGPRLRSVFPDNNTLRWEKSANGDITSLAVIPSGFSTLVGTANGNVTLFDQSGNISWSYVSNSGSSQNGEITCVALSKEGTMAAAGSKNGKVIVLNSTGGLILSNQTKDSIRHIAMSSDGSIVVAMGDNTIYAFAPSKQPAPPKKTSTKTITPSQTKSRTPVPADRSTQKPEITSAATQKITPELTQYSVIKTPTQSPLSGLIPLAGLLTALLVMARRR
jgi:WD40 repeat protein